MEESKAGRIAMTRKLHFTAKNFSVYSDRFIVSEDGTSKDIDFVEQPEVAIAVPVLSDGDLILLEHIRPLLGATLLECPGGKVDPGELPPAAVEREMSEEIGYRPETLVPLGSFYTSVGTSTERIHAFVAFDLVAVPDVKSDQDVGRMSIVRMSVAEARERVLAGILPDGKTYIALVAALHRGLLTDAGKGVEPPLA